MCLPDLLYHIAQFKVELHNTFTSLNHGKLAVVLVFTFELSSHKLSTANTRSYATFY